MSIINKIKAFLADENGAETIEWVVVAGVVLTMSAALFANSASLQTKVTALIKIVTDKMLLLVP